jgi:hypothetical protein
MNSFRELPKEALEKGERYGNYLIVGCREETRFCSNNIVQFLQNYMVGKSEFYAVYSIDGAIKRWVWDFPSQRAALSFVQMRRDVYDPARKAEIENAVRKQQDEIDNMMENAL